MFFLLLLLSIYKILFLLDCVIFACWETPWKKFLKPPLIIGWVEISSMVLSTSIYSKTQNINILITTIGFFFWSN